MSKWIEVSDGLPEEWEHVLACTHKGEVRAMSWTSNSLADGWWDFGHMEKADPVLAWCRYPSIPEEVAALVSEAGKERSE